MLVLRPAAAATAAAAASYLTYCAVQRIIVTKLTYPRMEFISNYQQKQQHCFYNHIGDGSSEDDSDSDSDNSSTYSPSAALSGVGLIIEEEKKEEAEEQQVDSKKKKKKKKKNGASLIRNAAISMTMTMAKNQILKDNWYQLTTSSSSPVPASSAAVEDGRRVDEAFDGDDDEYDNSKVEWTTTSCKEFACLDKNNKNYSNTTTTNNESLLFGKRQQRQLNNKKLSIRELVQTQGKALIVESNTYVRINWDECIRNNFIYMMNDGKNRNDNNNELIDDDNTKTTSIETNTNTNTNTNTDNKSTSTSTTYWFCYRDYINYEEIIAILGQRYSIERFTFRPARTGTMTFDETAGKVIMSELNIVFNFLPIQIIWEGQIKGNKISTIYWDTTSMKIGWFPTTAHVYIAPGASDASDAPDTSTSTPTSKRCRLRRLLRVPSFKLGKILNRPKVSERLRKDPWIIKILRRNDNDNDSNEDDNGDDNDNDNDNDNDILCFERIGKGHLIYKKVSE
jgi:hypothetical protein